MFKRLLSLPHPGTESFFLWGPRETGKSTLLRYHYPKVFWIDLLKADEFRRYSSRPEILREELLTTSNGHRQVVIDEIQKVPALLDEVHWLIENGSCFFALCGSSARKIKRGAANLLGGRALRYALHGLTAGELAKEFDLQRMLNHGYLPRIYASPRPARMLDTYIANYLNEEIAAEGLIRNLPTFSDFLEMASLSDGDIVNFSNIARECSISSQTVKNYFDILEDTLIGCRLPAYRKRPKRRVIGASKFYFFDVGIVNRLAHRGNLEPGSELFGKAFENWVHHELQACLSYREDNRRLSYWRLASGIEVDFILGDMEIAFEAKSGARINQDHLKGLRNLIHDHPSVRRRVVVCREPRLRLTQDGIEIMPVNRFIQELWNGAFD